MNTLPTESGLFWWKVSKDDEWSLWRVDFEREEGGCARLVDDDEWTSFWEWEDVGEWIPVQPPTNEDVLKPAFVEGYIVGYANATDDAMSIVNKHDSKLMDTRDEAWNDSNTKALHFPLASTEKGE